MNATAYPIQGGDYERAGAAARGLKEQLKRIGADPAAIRRAMIAAYEAEMNVVIHAHRGRLEARLDPARLDVEVSDEGPGIPDVDLAMKPGYSTAPAAARELGFGAGMGLPNIKKSSDAFAIASVVGRGTSVRFTIHLKPQEVLASGRRSVRIVAGRCRRCLRCLYMCPTGGLRIRGDGPEILGHLCIDCAACMAACPAGALAVDGAADALEPSPRAILVLPTALLAQFGPGVSPERVLAAAGELGWGEVWVTDAWAEALRSAVLDYARAGEAPAPVISPICPAAVNLVETRFPSLLGNLAPFQSPMVAARESLAGRAGVFVVACPAQRSALGSAPSGAAGLTFVLPAALRAVLLPRVAVGGAEEDEATNDLGRRTPGTEVQGVLRVTGVRHVLRVLEALENGLMDDVPVLELLVCDEGCFGPPTMTEDPFVVRHRVAGRRRALGATSFRAGAVRRAAPFAARAGLRLDSDMARAIEKLARINDLLGRLPGMDCGRCGAPTCAALAEDVVMGRADGIVCVRRDEGEATKP